MAINPDVTYADLQNMSAEQYGNFYSELKKLSQDDRDIILRKIEESTPEEDKILDLD